MPDPAVLIDAAARAMCDADEQRHRWVSSRGVEPCRAHLDAAYVAVEALLPLIPPACTCDAPTDVDRDCPQHGEPREPKPVTGIWVNDDGSVTDRGQGRGHGG